MTLAGLVQWVIDMVKTTTAKLKARKKPRHKKPGGSTGRKCMGGINEQKVPLREKGGGQETARSHLDTTTGEMHFHDENVSPRRTVTVPISLWYRVEQELQTLQRAEWEYLDPANGTYLKITTHITPTGPPDSGVQVTMNFDIMPATFNDTFKRIVELSKRQKPS